MGSDLDVEHRAFPLRPAPAADVPFKGTYREDGWRRCNQMSAGDGITFTQWRVHIALYEAFFTRSLTIADPAVLAQIVAEHGADPARFSADRETGFAREAVLADYEAAVSEHAVRAIPTVIIPETGRALVGLADLAVYRSAIEEAAG